MDCLMPCSALLAISWHPGFTVLGSWSAQRITFLQQENQQSYSQLRLGLNLDKVLIEILTYVILTSGGTLVNIQDFPKDGNNNRIIMVIVYDFICLCDFISCFRYGKRFSSICGDIIVLCIVGIIIYAIYRTCIADTSHGQSGDPSFRSHDRGSRPPPPGFRQDYMPNNGGKY